MKRGQSRWNFCSKHFKVSILVPSVGVWSVGTCGLFFFFLSFHVIGQKLQHFSTSEADRRKKNVTQVWTQLSPLRGRVVSWPQSVSGHVPSKCPLVMTFWNGHEITMDQGEGSDEDHRAERSMGAEFLAGNWTGHTGYSWLAAGRKHSYVNSG